VLPPDSDALLIGEPLAIDDARAAQIVDAHRDRAISSRALRGSARVALEGPDFKLNRPQRIAIERPSQLRFEVLGLFDVLTAMLVSDGEEFGFYDASTSEITRGSVTPDLLWRLAHLDLDPDEVVALLLASPLPAPNTVLAGVWLEADAGITVAYAHPAVSHFARGGPACEAVEESIRSDEAAAPCLASPADLENGAELFRFDEAGRLREMRSLEKGFMTRYRATFEDYADLGGPSGGRLFPMRITVDSPQVESQAQFEWKRIMLTDELPDRLFRIPERLGAGS